jgi:hypothetical protein
MPIHTVKISSLKFRKIIKADTSRDGTDVLLKMPSRKFSSAFILQLQFLFFRNRKSKINLRTIDKLFFPEN